FAEGFFKCQNRNKKEAARVKVLTNSKDLFYRPWFRTHSIPRTRRLASGWWGKKEELGKNPATILSSFFPLVLPSSTFFPFLGPTPFPHFFLFFPFPCSVPCFFLNGFTDFPLWQSLKLQEISFLGLRALLSVKCYIHLVPVFPFPLEC
ncbi:hypothetical protein Csa_023720, partial [Cucumis sativus]